jgi:hypothetical protein
MSVDLSDSQREWLNANLNEQGEVTYFENHQSYIDELCDIDAMKAVSGKFRCKPDVFTLYSVYQMTAAGRAALSTTDGEYEDSVTAEDVRGILAITSPNGGEA